MKSRGARPVCARPLWGVLGVILILAGVLPAPQTAFAQAPFAEAGPVAVLVRQPAWVGPGDAAVIEFRIPEPAGDLEVEVTAHRAVTSRSAFTRSLGGGGLGAAEGRVSAPVASLPVDAEGDRLLVVGIQGPETPPDATRIVPGRTGVYPLDVVFRRPGANPSTRFVTPLVVVAPGLIPLTLAWVWRFDATPAHLPDGRLRPSALRALAPGGRLARMAAAGAAAGNVRLTMAPSPETLEGWTEMVRNGGRRDGSEAASANPGAALGQFRAAAAQPGHQVLASPYVPAHLAGLAAAGLSGEIDRQFARGTEALTEALDAAPPPATLLAGSLDADALARLRQYGVERLVVPPSALAPQAQRLTPGRPFLLGLRGRPFDAAVSDPDLASLLTGGDPPALQAARFLAALSLVAFEAPREQRGVVVAMPPDWSPSATLLSTLVGALAGHPAVLTATIDEFFANTPPETADGKPLVRALEGAEEDAAELESGAIEATRRQVAALSEVMGAGQPRARAADRAVLIGETESLVGENRSSKKPAGTAYVKAARDLVADVTGSVQGPDGQRVTLTARRAQIPISLLNANPEPLQVRVRLESDQLRFPGGAERLLTLPPQNTTERFAVETRASGAFPLVISVTSPDGSLEVNRSELVIRSTVVSGVGALLTAGAGVFLLVWWGNDLRRSRRRPRAGLRRAEAPVPPAPEPEAPVAEVQPPE